MKFRLIHSDNYYLWQLECSVNILSSGVCSLYLIPRVLSLTSLSFHHCFFGYPYASKPVLTCCCSFCKCSSDSSWHGMFPMSWKVVALIGTGEINVLSGCHKILDFSNVCSVFPAGHFRANLSTVRQCYQCFSGFGHHQSFPCMVYHGSCT